MIYKITSVAEWPDGTYKPLNAANYVLIKKGKSYLRIWPSTMTLKGSQEDIHWLHMLQIKFRKVENE